MAIIEITRGLAHGRRFPVGLSSVMVGRDPACSILIEDAEVSRRHFQMRYDAVREAHVIIDVGSANGVLVNGVRIRRGSPHPLHSGDEILIGRSHLIYSG